MKVAIWGAGKMGQVHGEAYRKMGADIDIAYIIERDFAKAKAFSERFQCIAIEAPDVLKKGSVDIIDICLPTFLHRDAILQGAELCNYIFCEKPICLTPAEYDEILRMAESRHCRLMVGQVLRFWSGYIKVRELVQEGIIGTPRLITCLRRQKMPSWSKGGWLMDNQRSGGLLMDLCIHDIDYVYWLLGQPERVSCEIVRRRETTLHSILNLSYPEGCANIVGSWGMPEGFHGGELKTLLEVVGDNGMVTYTGGDSLELVHGSIEETIPLVHEDGYEQELAYFIDCFRRNEEPVRSDLSSVEGTMKILWAAQAAAALKQVVAVDKTRSCD